MTPRQVLEALHNDGITNDVQIFQDLILAHEGVRCEVCGHLLEFDSERGYVLDGKEE